MNYEYEPRYDAVFGELVYDPPTEDWNAVVALTAGHAIEVGIYWSKQDHGQFDPVLERARAAYLAFQEHEAATRASLAVAMLAR